MAKKNFAVYRPTSISEPRTVEITGASSVRAANRLILAADPSIIGRRDWLGVEADTPEEAIHQFLQAEAIRTPPRPSFARQTVRRLIR